MTREQGKFKFVPSVVKKKNFLYCGTSGRKNLAPGQEAKAKAVWSLCRLKGQGWELESIQRQVAGTAFADSGNHNPIA